MWHFGDLSLKELDWAHVRGLEVAESLPLKVQALCFGLLIGLKLKGEGKNTPKHLIRGHRVRMLWKILT